MHLKQFKKNKQIRPTQGKTLRLIIIHVLVGCYMSPGINRGARIYETLTRIPKVIKKKKGDVIRNYRN